MPRQTNDKHRASYIPYRCDGETYDAICKIAQTSNRTMAEVLRSLVSDGMVKQGYKQDEDAIYQMVRAALKEVLTPQAERLAAISAKATQISSAAFFLLVYIGRLYFPEDDRETIDEAAAHARVLGIEYLKLRGADIDSFLASAIQKMTEDETIP